MSFGIGLTFFSSFGQTFLIALFVPKFLEAFGLSNAQFGAIYAGATLLSALCLTYVGKLIDKIPLHTYSLYVVGGLVLAMTLLAIAPNVIVLAIGIWGLRMTGQGLMGHTSMTAMVRYFDHIRGRALSLASLGHPLGEAVFPMIVALLIGTVGWRFSLGIGAIITALFLVPFILTYIKPLPDYTSSIRVKGNVLKQWRQRDVLKDYRFYLLVPATSVLPFLVTGLFFYQISLAQWKGWTAEWVAFCFVGYALASSSAMILSGPLIDRFTARKMLPFYTIPLAIGLIVLFLFSSKWIFLAYLVLSGISNGMGASIRSAVQAEVYGVASIGAVRSLFTTLLVFSTAIGPAIIGLLLDNGYGFDIVLKGSVAILILTSLLSFILYPSVLSFIKKNTGLRKLYKQTT